MASVDFYWFFITSWYNFCAVISLWFIDLLRACVLCLAYGCLIRPPDYYYCILQCHIIYWRCCQSELLAWRCIALYFIALYCVVLFCFTNIYSAAFRFFACVTIIIQTEFERQLGICKKVKVLLYTCSSRYLQVCAERYIKSEFHPLVVSLIS